MRPAVVAPLQNVTRSVGTGRLVLWYQPDGGGRRSYLLWAGLASVRRYKKRRASVVVLRRRDYL